MPEYAYSLAGGRRVLIGLSAQETDEFERLDAQIPCDGKPVWPDTTNSPAELRWKSHGREHACVLRDADGLAEALPLNDDV